MRSMFLRGLAVVFIVQIFLGIGAPCFSGFGVETAYAQASEQSGGAADKAKKPETFMDYYRQGGTTMWPLLATAIWATSVMVELLIKLRKNKLCPPEVIQQLFQVIAVKDYQKAWKIGMDNPSSATRIFCAAIEKLPKGRVMFEEAAVEAASAELNIFRSKNAYINLNASIAPLLGLFGTISGMVGAFNSMAYSGAVGDPTRLAGDIGEALITTYAGLVIAIPCLCVYYILGNRMKKLMEYVQGRLAMLFDEIDFDDISPDLVVASKEMRLAYMQGGKGGAAAAAPAAASSAAKAKPAAAQAEVVPCPNCQKEVAVGMKKCPHCNSDLDWE